MIGGIGGLLWCGWRVIVVVVGIAVGTFGEGKWEIVHLRPRFLILLSYPLGDQVALEIEELEKQVLHGPMHPCPNTRADDTYMYMPRLI